MGELRENAATKIVTLNGIDMNAVAATDLYTAPTGKLVYINYIILRNASITLDTASFGFGWNANADDVVAPATLGSVLTATTKYRFVIPIFGAERGNAAEILKIGVDIAQGAPATMDVDVFGYLF